MHVGLIIDEERLACEQSLHDRVSVGLVEAGVRLTRVVPHTRPVIEPGAGEKPKAPAARVEVRMNVPPWMRRGRAHRLAGAMESAVPDLLHAVGEQAWRVGLDLAKVIDRPVTLDVWSAEQARRVPHSRVASRVAGYIVPTEPMAEALRQRVDTELVSVVPTGIVVPREPHTVLVDPEDAIALAIIGSGQDVGAYKAMLSGLSHLTVDFPQIQACLELRGAHEHDIWRHARRLDLLGHVSAIVDAALHRSLLTGCDILVVPERNGEVRSLMIQAMACGMPLVASDDPFLDMLVADQTAIVVGEADPDEWARQLRRLLVEPELARNLGASARAWVANRHRMGDHVAKLLAAFEQVLSGGAHSFVDPEL
ncbi:MAG: glycosyltransferase family 4 protein [Planctomycetota bacterium]|jgi:hypothetical protein